jgi:hypothetical protein
LDTSDAALRQARTTRASANNLLADDKPTHQNLQSTLSEVEAAVHSIHSLADAIERNPIILLRGYR